MQNEDAHSVLWLCFHANKFFHLAASGADAELRVVGLDLFVQDVMSSKLLLQICHGGAVLLHVHLFLGAQTPKNIVNGMQTTAKGQVWHSVISCAGNMVIF